MPRSYAGSIVQLSGCRGDNMLRKQSLIIALVALVSLQTTPVYAQMLTLPAVVDGVNTSIGSAGAALVGWRAARNAKTASEAGYMLAYTAAVRLGLQYMTGRVDYKTLKEAGVEHLALFGLGYLTREFVRLWNGESKNSDSKKSDSKEIKVVVG